jgi:hypothetical protein
MFTIDRYGRRIILLISMIGVVITTILLAGGFLAINKDSAMTLPSPNSSFFVSSVQYFDRCIKYRYNFYIFFLT